MWLYGKAIPESQLFIAGIRKITLYDEVAVIVYRLTAFIFLFFYIEKSSFAAA